jgi:aminopeptidase C
MRLHGMLEGSEAKEEKVVEGKSTSLKSSFNTLITQDPELSSIFKSDQKDNELIVKLREDLLKELLQLVETVVVEQNPNIKPAVLQKRLDDILSPKLEN